MNKLRFLLLTVLCVSVIACGCSKETVVDDQLSEEQSVYLNELIEKVNSTYSLDSKLDIYYEILELDPRNIDARIGIAHCNINKKNYDLARDGLLFVAKIDPYNQEVYELLAKISDQSGDLAYAEEAIKLAKQNNVESFLSQVPSEPVFSLAEGEHFEKVSLEITTDEPGATIYWSIDTYGIKDTQYTAPVRLVRGNNVVSAYIVKNGIPSKEVTMEYTISYEPTVVKFEESAFEKMVRLALNKPTGPITDAECETVTKLSWFDLRNTVANESAYQKLKIKSLADLQYFPMLTELVLEYQNKIADYSPLSYCPLLTTLQMDNCHLTSTDFVEFIPQIQTLKMYNYTTEWDVYLDTNPLGSLRHLTTIDTRGNNLGKQIDERSWSVYHIDNVIKNNPNLLYVNINSNHLTNWNLLLDLKEIKHINTWGIQNANYSVISKLTTLESLYIYFSSYEWNMSARSLSYLQNLDNLRKFGMQGLDDVSQLKYLKELEQIQEIVLANSDVVSDTEAMKELETALPRCKISASW